MPTISQTTGKILGFADLPDGWRYGQGRVIDPSVIKQALRLNAEAEYLGFTKTNAFASEQGGVQFVVYEDERKGDIEYEFNISPNGLVDFALIVASEDKEFREGMNFDLALSKLEECSLDLCDLSASYTQKTMTKKSTDFEVLHSPPPKMEYPLSMLSALKQQVGSYVLISTNSTPIMYEAPRLYFGK